MLLRAGGTSGSGWLEGDEKVRGARRICRYTSPGGSSGGGSGRKKSILNFTGKVCVVKRLPDFALWFISKKVIHLEWLDHHFLYNQ